MPPNPSAKRPSAGGHEPSTATLVREPPGGRPIAARPLGAIVHTVGGVPAQLRLGAGKCTIGAGAKADVVVADATVSRLHAELELVPEGVRVVDLGSRNGTYYLGHRVEKITLALGAAFKVGATPVVVEADGDALEGVGLFEGSTYRGMVGASFAMRRLFGMLTRLEGSLVTVLIEGESGVGKELIARALHEGSSVSSGPIVTVNCGALPRELIASELFGHKRGAFTGATDNRKGAFEVADGGTLFLDEIGELPLEVQPMLLRALEAGEIRPLGSDQPRRVKVRLVAATLRDLEAEVAAGRFREDLYFRLAVVRVRVPPLRERPEDIEPIARAFARASGIDDLPGPVIEKLRVRRWPGNAREVRNAVQAYAALGVLPSEGQLGSNNADVSFANLVDLTRPYADQKEDVADRFTRIYLQALMRHAGGNQTVAAKVAGLDRGYLGRLLVKHGLAKA